MKGLIFTYLLSYGGSLVAIFHPFVGLCIYYCFVVLRPQELWFYSVGQQGGNYSRYVALATLCGWALRGFSRGGPTRGTFSILLVFGGLVLLVQLSAWQAVDPVLAARVPSNLFKIFLMFLVGYCLLDSLDRLKVLLWVFLLSQGYLTFELNVPYFLTGFNRLLWEDGFGSLNNNTFALGLLPGTGMALMTAIFARPLLWKCMAGAVMLSSAHVILLSESRGAYLGLLAIGTVAFFFMPKNRASVSVSVLLALLVAGLTGQAVQNEFATMFADDLDHSATSRYDLWSAAFQVMMEHPWIGAGPENFGVFSGNYENVKEGRAAHNLFLQTGADYGLTGLVFLVLFYVLIFRGLYRVIDGGAEARSMKDPLILSIATGAFAGLAGYLTHSVFSSGILIETPYLTALLAAAACRLYHAKDDMPVTDLGYAREGRHAYP